jgi:mannose-6-phosphate isomerase class I
MDIPVPSHQRRPGGVLGGGVIIRFCNQLPFLFKVLAAAEPYHQCHPNLKQATKFKGKKVVE